MSNDREQRNAVFGGTSVDPRIPSVSAIDRVKADFGLDVPLETVPLPSLGKMYPTDHPLFDRETVDIQAMTAREEDILTSRALLKKGTVITELIKSCLIDKSIDPSDLIVGDRNALMVAIRITGYGSEYDAEVTCSSCEQKSKQSFDLSQLAIKRLSIEPVTPGANLFEFTLPVSKKRVRFRFMTGRMEEEIAATHDKQKKVGITNDSIVTTNLLYSIVSVEGIEDRAKLAQFVRYMPARDSLALRSYIADNQPDIVMAQQVTCQNGECGNVSEAMIPINTQFLWPRAK